MRRFDQLPRTPFNSVEEQTEETSYFKDLCGRYYSKIYNYSFRQTNNQREASESTTAFFVNVAQKVTTIKHPAEFITHSRFQESNLRNN